MMDEALELAALTWDSLSEGLQCAREDVDEFFTTHATEIDAEGLRTSLSILSVDIAHEPPVWDSEAMGIGMTEWIHEESGRCAEMLAERDSQAAKPSVRTPWEMIMEAIHISGELLVLQRSNGWIWSPMGPPVNTGEPSLVVFEGAGTDAEIDRAHEMLEKLDNRASEAAERHAAVYGQGGIDYETVEKMLLQRSDAAITTLEKLAEDEAERRSQLDQTLDSLASASTAKQGRQAMAGEAAELAKEAANIVLSKATMTSEVRAIADWDTYEGIGWDLIYNHARLQTLHALWQRRSPQPSQSWWKPMGDEYPLSYWQRRLYAADIEEERALSGDEGFLAAVCDVDLPDVDETVEA